MKRLTLIITLFGLLLLSGCVDDFLEHTPPVERTQDNFFQSERDAQQALFAVYEVLTFHHGRDNQGFHPFDLISNVLSDDAFGGGSGPGDQPEILEFNRHNISVTNGKALGIWSDRFTGIYRANLLLDNIDDVSFDNEETRAIMAAEARFLRVLFYYDLVRFFGYVPLVERPLVAEDIRIPQDDPDDVYNFMITELLDIIPDLRDNIPSNEMGRASSWAAKSMLGRIFLYHRDYAQPVLGVGNPPVSESEVIGHLEDVINNSGHELLDDFADLWGTDGNNNNEAIFSVQHIETSFGDWGFLNGSIGNWASQMTGLRGVGFHPEYISGWSFQPVTGDLAESFDEDADSRYFASILDPVEEGVNHDADGMHQWRGFAFKKFYPRRADLPSVNLEFNWPYNRPVIRFADVLLMAAELGASDAQNYFDQVRMRAYGDDFEQIPVNRENIMEERRLEFAGEGKRYWDLLRMGLDTAAETINARADGDIRIEFRTERLGLLPIPQSEINLSDRTLEQNPGY
ncbi:RagB/SusD family nutrient uptake outer membrane protein [Natronogracilivirga saccharolytica]|uniref:RagB/SusD family nutrient uptake outer membrane protein n=1 Tax=Natronogracilivirga saccharolytica TaxID=2812953 RepID=A0A8J7UU38_9BACT|nr:RagB/SusD family nutrient uptake outer membrane protein [Natronogracilivirga saccharolytica]MBP3191087.1 RagB/SusD family nutrient uptake outer membrane protein [Natronogracilivirga saccharolytica]